MTTGKSTRSSKPDLTPPLFPSANTTTPSLAMTIVFRTRRPLNHFVSNTRGRSLKQSAPSAFDKPSRTDVDNLAKFVLDSLNELLYEDDHQISSLCVTKLLDNQDQCLGSTEVSISLLSPENIEQMIRNTFDLHENV